MRQIKLFLDSADKEKMITAYRNGDVSGFTTNPTLMREAGVQDYEAFVAEIVSLIPGMSVSFEVFSDDLREMAREARRIFSFGENIFVKVPVTNTKGEITAPIIKDLSEEGIPLNITAMFTLDQLETVVNALDPSGRAILSIFAGRIANAGVDPMPIMKSAAERIIDYPNFELLWASAREAFNLKQAEECGCDIITMAASLIEATKSFGKDLTEYSLETVKMFYEDARAANFAIN